MQDKTLNCSAFTRRLYRSSAALKLIDLLTLQVDTRSVLTVLLAYRILDAAYASVVPAVDSEKGRGKVKQDGTRKYLPLDDWTALAAKLQASRTIRGEIAVSALSIIEFIGARPSELRTLKWGPLPKFFESAIIIQNGKFDEDGNRANSVERHLMFRNISPSDRDHLAFVRDYASKLDTAKKWATERKQIQKLIRAKCELLWPINKKRRYGLYSARHQFAADMKLAHEHDIDGLAIVAALMGHATDRTATSHYARKDKGRLRNILPRALKSEVALVRRLGRRAPRTTAAKPAAPVSGSR